MDINKYTNYANYNVAEIDVTCYNSNMTENILYDMCKIFDLYSNEMEFKYDGSTSFMLIGNPVENIKNLNIFTNFNKLLKLSYKFVNILFIYSFMVEIIDEFDCNIIKFIDVKIQNGEILNDKCIGCIFDDKYV